MNFSSLSEIASYIVSDGKGILAAINNPIPNDLIQ